MQLYFILQCADNKIFLYFYYFADYMHGIDCGNKKYIGGATVYSHREENSEYYMNNNECKITFKADNEGWRIMLRFLELDIPDIDPNNGICNDALYIYDSEDVFTGAMVSTKHTCIMFL